jgi:hypothetical protein
MNPQGKRMLIKRLRAWEVAGIVSKPKEVTGAPLQILGLKQSMPERTSPETGAKSATDVHGNETSPHLTFRAGQIWYLPDGSIDFAVDYSDRNELEIRWFVDHQWSEPRRFPVSHLASYIIANSIRSRSRSFPQDVGMPIE